MSLPWVDEWLQNELAVSFHVSLQCVCCKLITGNISQYNAKLCHLTWNPSGISSPNHVYFCGPVYHVPLNTWLGLAKIQVSFFLISQWTSMASTALPPLGSTQYNPSWNSGLERARSLHVRAGAARLPVGFLYCSISSCSRPRASNAFSLSWKEYQRKIWDLEWFWKEQ